MYIILWTMLQKLFKNLRIGGIFSFSEGGRVTMKTTAFWGKLSLFISAFLAPAAVFAAEIFVSTSGNDKNPGTENAPLQTLQKAVDQARAGDTVRILPGIYRSNTTITPRATAEKPLKIMGTRSADGKLQSILEAESKILTAWTPAPEIGENVWKIKLSKRPDTVMLDGKMIAQINKFNMLIPRRKQIPDKLTAALITGNHNPKTSKRMAGFDLLAAGRDLKVYHDFFKIDGIPFWETIGNVICGWSKGNLYIRFADDSKPEKHTITASYGDGVTLKNASHIILSDLYIRGSKNCVHIIEKSNNITIENSLFMNGANRVLVAKEASDVTVRNNILTLGFIRNKYHTGDKRSRVTYLVFKYIIGVAKSDDCGVNFNGSNCSVYGNIFVNGLVAVRAHGPGAKVYGNCIRKMSSCGIVTGGFSSGEFYENLIMECGLNLRIHDWRHERFYRTEYHYRNLFLNPNSKQLHIYGISHKKGHDKVNFDKKGIYKANPPAPFDPGKIFLYNNTFCGGSAGAWPIKNYYARFRKQALPFYFMNNIAKSNSSWEMKHHHVLAGNLMYVAANHKNSAPAEGVDKFNKIVSLDKNDTICVDLFNKKLPDIRLKENSPAKECAIDVSKPFEFNGLNVPALPGFKPGYFSGKAPAAGAIQAGDDKLMEHFTSLYNKMLETEQMLASLK